MGTAERDEVFEAAFNDLLGRALSAARSVLGPGPAAEDVAAETMARTYGHWAKVSGLPYREAWVARVAANLAIDSVRRRPAPVQEAPVATSGERGALNRMVLVAAVRRLPRRQRQVVVLSYLSDVAEADVASLLGISNGSVKTHLHRGLAALRASLGPDSEEWNLAVFD
jgi:RNA polymerase sigma factor (sigma-70 family)